MAICSRCGKEFDLGHARKVFGRNFGAGTYNDWFPDGDVCEDCGFEEEGNGYIAGAEIKELMGDNWDDD